MARILVRLTLAVWLVVPTAATAGTVTLSTYTSGPFATRAPNGGGPFKAVTVGGELGTQLDGFLTFCLEFNEHFVPGVPYYYALSDSAILGGVAGGWPEDDDPDPVSDATKWLYYNALSGGYVGLVTTVVGASHKNLSGHLALSGRYLQEAIWFLEEERTYPPIHANSHALAQLALSYNDPLDPDNLWKQLEGEGHRVYAMNLTASDGSLKQDQLAYTVPEPGTLAQLATLAPIGLLGYLAIGASRLVRRRPR